MAKKISSLNDIKIEFSSEIDKIISKEFDNLIDLSKLDSKVNTWFNWGVYSLNYICSKNLFGGIPSGRVTSIDGLPSTGKSIMVASAMKDPKIDLVILIESEGGGSSKELLEFVGVNVSKVKMLKANTFENYKITKKSGLIEEISDNKFPQTTETPEAIYKEGVTRLVKKLINKVEFNNIKANILVVLDSLGNLQTTREMNGIKDVGYRTQMISQFFKNFDLSFERTSMAFVFTNKLYTNIGDIYDPWKVSGGVNVEYNPSLSIRLRTTAETYDVSDSDMKAEKERRKTALGSSLKTINAKVTKSRFGTEFRNVNFLLDFSVGPVRLSGLFGLCKDFGIIQQTGSTYKLDGVFEKSFYKKDFINLILQDEEGNLKKIQDKLEEAENKIKTEKLTLQINDIEETGSSNEEEINGQEIINEMTKDMEKSE